MSQIIQLLLSLGFKYHKKESTITNRNTYVFNWNGVRHWVQVYCKGVKGVQPNAVHFYSFQEGTGDDNPILDTGEVLNPTDIFIRDIVDKQKELM